MAPSVALVHDYLLVMRGAERAFAAIAECWPEAPIYTLLYDEEKIGDRFVGRDVRTSYLQRLGVGQRRFRALLPVFGRAARSLPLGDHDLIVSSSSAFAHTVVPRAGARHLSYCHSPFRYAWFEAEKALGEVPAVARPPLRHVLWRARESDRRAACRVTRYVANSQITRARIREFWGRESRVVHPPVEVDRFHLGPRHNEYFLIVTELVRHKRVEFALEAARRAGVAVRIVGEGPDRERLENRYGDGGVRFLGRVDDEALADLHARARAFVLPNVEEFGIAAVEAQAAGRPVVAIAAGGALETVRPGETGVLVEPGDVDALARVLAETDFDRFVPEKIADHARTFSKQAFKRRLLEEVDQCLGEPTGVVSPTSLAASAS